MLYSRYGARLVPGRAHSPSQSGFGGRDPVAGAHDALGDVVDVGEVAAVMPVVEDVDRPAGEDVAREQEQRHVGPAPRAVDGEETQPRHGQRIELGIGVRHELVGLLRRGVERQRVIDVLVDGERHPRVGAVHRAGRGVDEMRDAVVPASLEDVRGADHVAVDVGEWILDRIAHAGLGAEVDHALELLAARRAPPCPARSARSSFTKRNAGCLLEHARGAPA